MSNRHTQIALADAAAGMTLADAVLDTRGNVLLPAGAVLSTAMLVSLQRHDVDSIAIVGASIPQAQDSAEREQRMTRVNWLFRQPGTAVGAGSGTGAGADAGTNIGIETPHADAMATSTEVLHQYMLRFRGGESA